MQRLTHDIRNASSIDGAGSNFGTTAGVLKVIATDTSDISTSTTYSATNGTLFVAEGSAVAIPLLPPTVGVQGFTVYQITTAHSLAVRIVLELETSTTTMPISATFYDTAILRGSY